MGSKDAPQKMQFLGAIKKWEVRALLYKKAKVAEKTHRFGRHRSRTGPKPSVLAYSKSP